MNIAPCKNHADSAAVGHCAGCAEPFCANCTVDMGGRTYCGSCKVLAVEGRTLVVESNLSPCKEAQSALVMALISPMCFGIILGPMAILKAIEAKKLIAANPQLTGSGKANAAFVIGIFGLAFWFLSLLTRFQQ